VTAPFVGVIDEAHIHLDTDEGYGWSIKGERFGLVLVLLDLEKSRSMGLFVPTWAKCASGPMAVEMGQHHRCAGNGYGMNFPTVQ
jgi:hypothetical protein